MNAGVGRKHDTIRTGAATIYAQLNSNPLVNEHFPLSRTVQVNLVPRVQLSRSLYKSWLKNTHPHCLTVAAHLQNILRFTITVPHLFTPFVIDTFFTGNRT